MGTVFGVYKGLVVVIREGCGSFWGFCGVRLQIFGCESQLQWYTVKSECFGDFLKSVRKGQNLDIKYK